MSKLDGLVKDYRAAEKAIEKHLKRLRRTCSHKVLLRTRASGGGYLHQCERCFIEEHGWSPYKLRPNGGYKGVRDVDYNYLLGRRPPGGQLVLVGEDE